MYNGIGLNSVRGTGTSGHVRLNAAAARRPRPPAATPRRAGGSAARARLAAVGAAGIRAHERARRVEVAVASREDALVAEGVPRAEAAERAARLREELRVADGEGGGSGGVGAGGTAVAGAAHVPAAACAVWSTKEAENGRMREALGISKDYEEGSAFQRMKRERGDAVEAETNAGDARDAAVMPPGADGAKQAMGGLVAYGAASSSSSSSLSSSSSSSLSASSRSVSPRQSPPSRSRRPSRSPSRSRSRSLSREKLTAAERSNPDYWMRRGAPRRDESPRRGSDRRFESANEDDVLPDRSRQNRFVRSPPQSPRHRDEESPMTRRRHAAVSPRNADFLASRRFDRSASPVRESSGRTRSRPLSRSRSPLREEVTYRRGRSRSASSSYSRRRSVSPLRHGADRPRSYSRSPGRSPPARGEQWRWRSVSPRRARARDFSLSPQPDRFYARRHYNSSPAISRSPPPRRYRDDPLPYHNTPSERRNRFRGDDDRRDHDARPPRSPRGARDGGDYGGDHRQGRPTPSPLRTRRVQRSESPLAVAASRSVSRSRSRSRSVSRSVSPAPFSGRRLSGRRSPRCVSPPRFSGRHSPELHRNRRLSLPPRQRSRSPLGRRETTSRSPEQKQQGESRLAALKQVVLAFPLSSVPPASQHPELATGTSAEGEARLSVLKQAAKKSRFSAARIETREIFAGEGSHDSRAGAGSLKAPLGEKSATSPNPDSTGHDILLKLKEAAIKGRSGVVLDRSQSPPRRIADETTATAAHLVSKEETLASKPAESSSEANAASVSDATRHDRLDQLKSTALQGRAQKLGSIVDGVAIPREKAPTSLEKAEVSIAVLAAAPVAVPKCVELSVETEKNVEFVPWGRRNRSRSEVKRATSEVAAAEIVPAESKLTHGGLEAADKKKPAVVDGPRTTDDDACTADGRTLVSKRRRVWKPKVESVPQNAAAEGEASAMCAQTASSEAAVDGERVSGDESNTPANAGDAERAPASKRRKSSRTKVESAPPQAAPAKTVSAKSASASGLRTIEEVKPIAYNVVSMHEDADGEGGERLSASSGRKRVRTMVEAVPSQTAKEERKSAAKSERKPSPLDVAADVVAVNNDAERESSDTAAKNASAVKTEKAESPSPADKAGLAKAHAAQSADAEDITPVKEEAVDLSAEGVATEPARSKDRAARIPRSTRRSARTESEGKPSTSPASKKEAAVAVASDADEAAGGASSTRAKRTKTSIAPAKVTRETRASRSASKRLSAAASAADAAAEEAAGEEPTSKRRRTQRTKR